MDGSGYNIPFPLPTREEQSLLMGLGRRGKLSAGRLADLGSARSRRRCRSPVPSRPRSGLGGITSVPSRCKCPAAVLPAGCLVLAPCLFLICSECSECAVPEEKGVLCILVVAPRPHLLSLCPYKHGYTFHRYVIPVSPLSPLSPRCINTCHTSRSVTNYILVA